MKDKSIQKKLAKMHSTFFRLCNDVAGSGRSFAEYGKLLYFINRADELTVSAFHEICKIEEEKK